MVENANLHKMNTFGLVYALSENGQNDFQIRRSSSSDELSHLQIQNNPEESDESEEVNNLDSCRRPLLDSKLGTLDLGHPTMQIHKEKVIMLSNAKGSLVYLLGTNHASPESQMAVDSLIKKINPHIVVVELCKTRIGLSPLKTFKRNRAFNRHLLKDAIVELGFTAGCIWYSMAYMERFISRLLNVDYGGDMKAPGTSASFQITSSDFLQSSKQAYLTMLGDRPIEVTMKRMASVLTIPEKMAIWFFNICSAVLGLRCYLLNVPTILFRSLDSNKVLLGERDTYLTYSLQLAANLKEEPLRVIGIVGKAHVAGVVFKWNTITEDDVKKVTADRVRE